MNRLNNDVANNNTSWRGGLRDESHRLLEQMAETTRTPVAQLEELFGTELQSAMGKVDKNVLFSTIKNALKSAAATTAPRESFSQKGRSEGERLVKNGLFKKFFIKNYLCILLTIYSDLHRRSASVQIRTKPPQHGMLRWTTPKWTFQWEAATRRMTAWHPTILCLDIINQQ